LDVGAMEGYFSVMACRRGASSVLATDRYDLSTKIGIVQRMLAVHFDYAPNTHLDGNAARSRQHWGRLADLTIFSGVLYHTLDPMAALARVRGMVRKNGLVIVETVAAISDEESLLYNEGFWMYSPETYFIATTGALGAILPFLGLKPIDCRYFTLQERNGVPLCRIAICCRAVDIPVLASPPPAYATGVNAWFLSYAKLDLMEFIDLETLDCDEPSTIGYRSVAGFDASTPDDVNPLQSANLERPGLVTDPKRTRLGLGEAF
jgi:hypothetical protein